MQLLNADAIVPIANFRIPEHFRIIQPKLLATFEQVAMHGGALRDYYTGLNSHGDLDFHVRGLRPNAGRGLLQRFLSADHPFADGDSPDLLAEFQAVTGLKPAKLLKFHNAVNMKCEWSDGQKKEELDVSLFFEDQQQAEVSLEALTIKRSKIPFCAVAMSQTGQVSAHPLFEEHAQRKLYRTRTDVSLREKILLLIHYEKIRKKYPSLELQSDMKPLFVAGQMVEPDFFTKLQKRYRTWKSPSGASL